MLHEPSLGASARKNPGIPIVSVAASVRCRGSSGYAVSVSPIRRMRKAANADFVTNSFATRWTFRRIFRPSRDHRRDGGEVAARRGRRRRRCAPSPSRCPARSRAAPPSARARRSRRRRPSRRSGPSRAAARRAPSSPPARCGRSRVASSAGSPCARVDDPVADVGMPASRAIAATVSGASPEMTRSSTPSRRKNSTVSRASRAQLLGEDDEPERLQAGGGRRPARATRGVAERDHAAAAAPARARVARARPSANSSGAPSTYARRRRVVSALQRRARGERHVVLGRSPPRPGPRPRSPQRRVRAGELAAKRPSARAQLAARRSIAARRGRRAGGCVSVPGLVEAEHVDRGERLDRVQLLRQRAAPRELQRRGGERER